MFSTSVRTMNAAPTHLVARKTGIRALGLVLGHEGIGNAADRTAQTGGLAALEEDDADDDQTAEKLKNRNE